MKAKEEKKCKSLRNTLFLHFLLPIWEKQLANKNHKKTYWQEERECIELKQTSSGRKSCIANNNQGKKLPFCASNYFPIPILKLIYIKFQTRLEEEQTRDISNESELRSTFLRYALYFKSTAISAWDLEIARFPLFYA